MGTFTKDSGNCVRANGAAPPSKKLLDQLRERIRVKHYSLRTEQAYGDWVRRFILFHGQRRRREMGTRMVEAFRSHLAVEGRVSASTRNQARSALWFLYQEELQTELPWLEGVEPAKTDKGLPASKPGTNHGFRAISHAPAKTRATLKVKADHLVMGEDGFEGVAGCGKRRGAVHVGEHLSNQAQHTSA